uniref:Pyruvate decarboxylase n=1 Tax=Starmerella bombicola TaxID=75736 RepID=A0A0U1YLZ6_STABO|nr:pyruvate decarboxylase [Starmerella bombicola]
MSADIPLGTYLFKRLNQVGIEHIFGVPGDFNLKLLDHVYNVEGLKWVGTCNELNGAYAADGYARESGVPGVIVTTYAVGELSALNGISGANAENVPVIHIVGQSPRFAQDEHVLLHHSPAPHGLRPNDHSDYEKASEPLCCTTEKLWDPKKAPEQIDNLIYKVMQLKEPGTLFVPADMVSLPVSTANLSKKIAPAMPFHPSTDEVAQAILDAFAKAKRPVVLNDLFATRFNMKERTMQILERTGAYGYCTFLGRSSIEETHPQFGGVYNGQVSLKGVSKAIEEDSDFILNIGAHVSDFNSGGMSRTIDDSKLIIVHAFYARVFGKNYDNVFFGHVLDRVLQQLPVKVPAHVDTSKPKVDFPNPELKGKITQLTLPHVISKFLTPGDTLIAETGTFQYGSRCCSLPKDALYFAQYYYSSIGFALPLLSVPPWARLSHPIRTSVSTLLRVTDLP